MKALKVIILLFLVLKSTGGFSFSTGCCEEDTTQVEMSVDTDDTSDDEKDDCCGGDCDCLCCSHIFTHQRVMELSIYNPPLSLKSEIAYIQSTYKTDGETPWQPPRL